jgi:hypothetical protein
MRRIEVPFRLESTGRDTINLAHVALGTDADDTLPCGTK